MGKRVRTLLSPRVRGHEAYALLAVFVHFSAIVGKGGFRSLAEASLALRAWSWGTAELTCFLFAQGEEVRELDAAEERDDTDSVLQ